MIFNPLQADPTRTVLMRKNFQVYMVRLWNKFSGIIKETVIDEDALAVEKSPSTSFSIFYPWRFLSPADRIKSFGEWLLIEGKNQIISPFEKEVMPRLKSTLLQGITQGYDTVSKRMKKPVPMDDMSLGFAAADRSGTVNQVYKQQKTQETVDLLRERSLSDLRGILDVLVTQSIREVMDLTSVNSSVDDIYLGIRSRVEAIGINRSKILVNSDAVRWYTTGQLLMFEHLGVKTVRAVTETSKQGTLCTTCQKITETPIQEAWNLLPLHPSCFCSWGIAS